VFTADFNAAGLSHPGLPAVGCGRFGTTLKTEIASGLERFRAIPGAAGDRDYFTVRVRFVELCAFRVASVAVATTG
jgi:hypothetical protein